MTNTPSLLEPESRGGETAIKGFSVQDMVLMQKIPEWLSYSNFGYLIYEAVGDIEAKFFSPKYGSLIEFIEVKKSKLSPKLFWDEIERFKTLYNAAPDQYREFILVCKGVSSTVDPVINALARMKDHDSFYEFDSVVAKNSLMDFVNQLEKLGQSENTAQFLINKVQVRTEHVVDLEFGKSTFFQKMTEHLPEYKELSLSRLDTIYGSLLSFLRQRTNSPISRREIEQVIYENIPDQLRPNARRISIYTSVDSVSKADPKTLFFQWSDFFGGDKRQYPNPEDWNQILMSELNKAKQWIIETCSSRKLSIGGVRRLSATFALGHVFSAVAGFDLELDYREEKWCTSDYANAETVCPQWSSDTKSGNSKDLIVTIGCLRDISAEVKSFCDTNSLADSSVLNIVVSEAITSAKHANLLVQQIKMYLSEELANLGSLNIHLFYAGPSHLALILAHRLNATASITCYERVSPANYVETCHLLN